MFLFGQNVFVDGTTPNGVEVRGLRILYSTEYRRISIWKSALMLLLEDLVSDDWYVLTVNDGQRKAVARRRFTSQDEAKRARGRFVEIVSEMSRDTYAGADWQSVLDAV